VSNSWAYSSASDVLQSCSFEHRMSWRIPAQETAKHRWRVWGTPANFNGFRVLASLLHRRRSTDVNQTLHDVWPSPALVYDSLYTFSALAQLQNSVCVQVLRSAILAALLHGTRAVGVRQSLRRGTRNGIMELSQRTPPILTWRPSRWASAHILVVFTLVSSLLYILRTEM